MSRAAPVRPPHLRDAGEAGLWRAVDVYRVLTLAYAFVLFLPVRDRFRHVVGAWLVLAVMTGWTAVLAWRRERPTTVLWADIVVAAACVLATDVVDDPARIAHGDATLPSMWAAAPVIAFAVARGWRMGVLSAAVISVVDVVEVWPHASGTTVDSIVQLLVVGLVVGYTSQVYADGRARMVRASAVEAATKERERLAADIHDSVLQVLAYVQRRGAEIGGEAVEIGRLAGEQEVRLRCLIGARPSGAAGEKDLSQALAVMEKPNVSVAVPAGGVPLPAEVVGAAAAAVRAALDNVERHAGPGACAWVLLEDEVDTVTVTVRDDGVGMAEGRLAAAEREGRLGMAAGIRARIATVGGSVDVISAPGEGVEVEIRIPRGTVGRSAGVPGRGPGAPGRSAGAPGRSAGVPGRGPGVPERSPGVPERSPG